MPKCTYCGREGVKGDIAERYRLMAKYHLQEFDRLAPLPSLWGVLAIYGVAAVGAAALFTYLSIYP